MGRAPCCDKMGLKKGPWTPEEDRILVNHIRVNGHSNWRALPKQAGLLRCGKSCRLRWINYLRPDIKRGNFSQHEEETIINLHELLGNRWSAIAAKLPGRTDNEIKNVWHTHLKRRLPPQANNPDNFGSTTTTTATGSTTTSMPIKVEAVPARKPSRKVNMCKGNVTPKKRESTHEKIMQPNGNSEIASSTTNIIVKAEPVSPQPCTSEVSTVTSTSTNSETNPSQFENDSSQGTSTSTNDTQNNANQVENTGTKDYLGELPDINDEFWMEVLSVEDTAISTNDLPCIAKSEDDILGTDDTKLETEYLNVVNSEDMDVFWHNLLTETLELPEITEIL